MPHVLKPKFEQHRATLLKSAPPLREKEIVPIQAAFVEELGALPDLLIEKVRRLPRPEGMLEITAKYMGLAADQTDLVKYLQAQFPEGSLGLENLLYWVGPSEEAVLAAFAGQKDGRNLTGRILITLS